VAYIKLTRPHWFVASTLAAMIGIFHAWANGSYQLLLAVLVIVGVILHHAIMETWDELQDYANYREEMVTDSAGPPTLFSGGSGVLTGQLLTVRQVWRFFFATVGVAVLVLGGIIDHAGWGVMVCVAAGVFVMVNYNAMLKLSYRGLGEFANFISFGPIMVCSTYVVLTLGEYRANGHSSDGSLSSILGGAPLVESVIIGAIWFGSLHIQEMLDYDEDLAGNKRTLVVRFGKEYGSRVPVATAAVIVALVVYLSVRDPGFVVVLPAAVWHLYDTISFMRRWRDQAYFMRKMKSFFVYRNFVLICLSILISFVIRDLPHAAGDAALLSLALLTVASAIPAAAFLAGSRLPVFAGRQR
jgi:1,4-dihydroxy-2-naphthoate polyprenyltransferase